MVTQQGNLAPFAREIGNPLLESFYSQVVCATPSARFPPPTSLPVSHIVSILMGRSFLYTYLPLRARNPAAHTSISLDTIAAVANTFLARAFTYNPVRNEAFQQWDPYDIFGVCVNLIDQVPPPCPSCLPQDTPGLVGVFPFCLYGVSLMVVRDTSKVKF